MNGILVTCTVYTSFKKWEVPSSYLKQMFSFQRNLNFLLKTVLPSSQEIATLLEVYSTPILRNKLQFCFVWMNDGGWMSGWWNRNLSKSVWQGNWPHFHVVLPTIQLHSSLPSQSDNDRLMNCDWPQLNCNCRVKFWHLDWAGNEYCDTLTKPLNLWVYSSDKACTNCKTG